MSNPSQAFYFYIAAYGENASLIILLIATGRAAMCYHVEMMTSISLINLKKDSSSPSDLQTFHRSTTNSHPQVFQRYRSIFQYKEEQKRCCSSLQ